LLSDSKRMRYVPEQFFLRSADEMKALFHEVPEAVQNTLEVAEKCNVEIQFNKLYYPVFAPPEHFTREGYLRQLLAEGLHTRYSLRVRAEGEDFIVDSLEDARRLPTFMGGAGVPPAATDVPSVAPSVPTDLSDPNVSAAVKAVTDR